jgi:hypothetical protein
MDLTCANDHPRGRDLGCMMRNYQRLAAEARKQAEAATDEPTLRQCFLNLAAACDKLADTLEQSPFSSAALGRPLRSRMRALFSRATSPR